MFVHKSYLTILCFIIIKKVSIDRGDIRNMIIRRNISNIERFMLFFGRQYPLNFGFKLDIDISLEEGKVRETLKHIAMRHPLLFAYQQFANKPSMDMVFDDSTSVIIKKTEDDSNWETYFLKCITREFDPFSGPLFSLDWRIRNSGSELFFVFHHAAADGIAAVQFIHDFLLCYNDQELLIPQQPVMPVLYDELKKEIYHELAKRPEPEWKKEQPPEPVTYNMPPYKVPEFNLKFFEISSSSLKKILKLAKSTGLSLTSYLGANILKESSLCVPSEKGLSRTIQCPVDFRPYMIEDHKNIVGIFNGIVKVVCDCSKTVTDIGLQIQKGIREQRTNLKDIEEYFHFRDSFDNVPDPESLMMSFPVEPVDYDFSFSNIGKTIIQEKYGKCSVSSFYGPVFTAVNGETVIGLNTTNGVLRMSIIYDNAIKNAKAYKLLGDSIERILGQF